MTFRERLRAAVERQHSHLCVGLDPDLDRLPPGYTPDPDDVLRFCTAIVEATSDVAAAYKPNSAFYEAMGPAGMEVLQVLIASIPGDIPVILDAKRGDMGNTADRYATALFDIYGAGAVTVSPYLGGDSLEPFLSREDRGTFILCRTSNPGAADLQDLVVGDVPLYIHVARKAREWDTRGNVGLVTGATWPAEVAAVRAECPDMALLLPGVGAQAGDPQAAARAGAGPSGEGLYVIAASRSVMHASTGNDFQHAAADAAVALRDEVEAALARP